MRVSLAAALVLLCLCFVEGQPPPPPPWETNDEEPTPEPSRFDIGYLIMAPKTLTAGTTETVCIRLLNMTGPITVTISLLEDSEAREELAAIQPYFMDFPFVCLNLEVPVIDGDQKQTVFQVTGRTDLEPIQNFTESKRVWIKTNNWESFIQTDKSIYKPGQTVKFRMLTIDQNFRPDLTKVSKMWVEAPSGIHMAQWLDIETAEKDGLVDLEFPMTSDPPLGKWKIKAVHQGKDVLQEFTVDEYVLPKFEIDIQAPPYILVNASRMDATICAKYTYGQPVRGSLKAAFSVANDGWSARPRATIRYQIEDTGRDGCQDIVVEVYRLELNSTDFGLWNARINVDVEFTETSTGVTLSEKKDITKVATEALTLKFNAPETFKPGVPYYGKIFVTYPDGTPAGGRTVKLTADTNEGRVFEEILISSPNGVIDFTAKNISIQASNLHLYAVAPGYSNRPDDYDYRYRYRFMYDPSVSFGAQPQFSPSGSFIQIAPILETVSIGSVQTLTIDFTARDAEKEKIDFNFMFMSRGNILRSNIDSLQSTDQEARERPARQAEPDPDFPSEPSGPIIEPSDFGIIDPSEPEIIIDPSYQDSISSDSSDEEPIIIVKPGELNTVQAQVTVTPEMMPVTRVLVYYIRKDGEVVADTLTFNVQEVFENEVTMGFADEEAAPGETTMLRIQAAPGSLCGVGVVDKSVQLLGGDNQLKKSKIFSSLEKHQLSERDGELDPSTHCPAPVPWWARLGAVDRRRKRSVIYSPHQTYKDASLAFQQMGLIFLTNIKVETRPCRDRNLYYRGRGIPDVLAGPVALPQAVPFFDEPEPVFEKEVVALDNEIVQEAAPVTVRTYFPETWLWDLVRISPESSEAEVEVEVPDTITDWIGSGFCTSTEHGVGVSGPTTLRAFQPFFASYNLPYSVIRGEEVPIAVTVFNYLSECLVVELTLQDSADFVLKDKDSAQRICVCGGDSKTAAFNVSFTSLGMIPIEVHAVAVEDTSALCGNDVVSSSSTGFSDGIRRELLVEAEGVEEEYTINSYFCPEETGVFTSVNNLALPINVVKDSQKAKITVTGDLMGPTLSNLDKLLRVPTGCGEQNMLGMVPNIFVMQYLESTEQLTPATADKAKSNMEIGYQRELNYRRDDNSYSAFGMSDPEGSTWLTAFVVRSYAQASEYIYIDDQDLDLSINWLRERQSETTGCFESRGKLCHKAMAGGVNNELTLTAYIVITMLEAGLPETDPAVAGGLRCLVNGIPNLSDTYTTTQMAYALSLASGFSANLTTVMIKLEEAAVEEDGLKYWKSNRPQSTESYGYYGVPAQDIEMTGYALLAYMQQTVGGEALIAGNPIARWIVSQRNSQGGFSSTQDTVIGLQALATYADLAYTGGVAIHLKVRTHPQRLKHSFLVNTANRLIMQEFNLDAKNVPTRVSFEGRGLGCALLQTAVSYNVIPKEPTTPAFTISHDVREIERAKRCSQYSMQVCTSYTGDDEESNMALLRVKMQTGFVPVKSTLDPRVLRRQSEAFRKVEVDGKMINFYFDKVTAEETCLVFSIEKSIDVKDVKDGAVTILDYYEQSLSLSEMVKLPCPEVPNYLDPTFQDDAVLEVPLEPRRPFLPGPLGTFRAGGFPGEDTGEPEDADLGIFDNLDISSFNQCPEGKVFADGVKKCVAPTGDPCQDNTMCQQGYTCIDMDTGSKCVDLDECSKYADICKGDSICTNIVGSYLCAYLDCGKGYRISADGHCEDLNECDMQDVCDGICINREGSYECISIQVECIEGFRMAPNLECEDIDECVETPDICGPGNLCANTLGSYVCAIADCGLGYIKDKNGTCVDVDECEELDACGPEETCINMPGSFACRSLACGDGFRAQLDSELGCIDIDECAENPDICGLGNLCANTLGSYACAIVDCGFGFRKNENGTCVDNDECEEPDACGPGETCVNMPGSFSCTSVGCADGYEPSMDPTPELLCIDIDECADKDVCPSAQTCVNTDGSYECVEAPGEPEDVRGRGACGMPVESGLCLAAFPMYAFNSESGMCEGFVYGGCGGNDNRFDTLELCKEACEPEPVVVAGPSASGACGMPIQAGPCYAYFVKYAFNSESGMCEEFGYGGCRGNDNRFDTLELCKKACEPEPVVDAGLSASEICKLPVVVGKCRGYFPKFGYVAESKRCESFVYGGCDGNDNRFNTVEECMNFCGNVTEPVDVTSDEIPLPELCKLPMVTGLCRGNFRVFGYNAELGECEQFSYGGCGGNVNRFKTEAECTDTCGSLSREVPPFLPKKYEDEKIGQCPPYIDDNGPCERECYGDNADCPGNRLCCFNGCGYQCTPFILEDPPEPKEGSCAPALPGEGFECSDVVTECFYDYNCEGNMKCCQDGCNSLCVEPITKVELVPPPGQPKAGMCPRVKMETVGACAEECNDDYACPEGQKCCSNGCGHSCMPAYNPIVHEFGECPLMTETGTCPNECTMDSDCANNGICCFTGCGRACSYAVIVEPLPPKPGQCPVLSPLAVGLCADFCQFDYDCSEGEKCCSNGCGFECMQSSGAEPVGPEILPPEPGPPKPGQCPVQDSHPPCLVLAVINQCNDDGDCEGPEKCCDMECNSRFCVPPVISPPKPGQCPMVEPGGFGICVQECDDDSGCMDDKKCCFNGCGKTCMDPITVPSPPKPGQCPVVESGGFGICVQECNDDSGCMNDQKCCSNGCGKTCVDPITVPSPPKPGQCPVVESGGFGICVQECDDDSGCMDDKKCCSYGCGKTCMDPITVPSPPKPGQCPVVESGGFGICVQECDDDSGCMDDKKCCSSGCGKFCMDPITIPSPPKPGQCPVVESGGFGICVQECDDDSGCMDDKKCCSNGCGKTCVDPITVPSPPKPGQCPVVESGGFGICVQECDDDSGCMDDKKCCSNGCGKTCMDPITVASPPKPGQCPVVESGGVGICVQECDDDSGCMDDKKCCSNGCGKTCVDPINAPKPGRCPSLTMETFGICVEGCTDDYSCPDDQKCCTNGCGHSCMPAYDASVHTVPGECPPVSEVGTCEDACTVDADCGDKMLICCFNGCGRSCTPFVIIEPPMPRLGVTCPAVPEGTAGVCANFCEFDYDCEETEMCCSNGCGYQCTPFVVVGPPEPLGPIEPVGTVEPVGPIEPVQPQAPKPGVCPMVDLGTTGICTQECDDDHACEGTKKCCTNGCGNTCMPAYDPALNNFSECPLVTDVGSCAEECSVDSDCASENQICCFNGCGHSCILLEGTETFPEVSLDCPYCLTDLVDLPDDIVQLLCDADYITVVKWRQKDNRVRFLRDLITEMDITQPSRLLELHESCPCTTIANDERVILIGQMDSIITGRGRGRRVTLGTNSFAIRNDAKLKKQLDDIRSKCP